MIDLHLGDPILVVRVTVTLGFFLLLFTLLAPVEPVILVPDAVHEPEPAPPLFATPAVEAAPDIPPAAPAETFSAPPSMVPAFTRSTARPFEAALSRAGQVAEVPPPAPPVLEPQSVIPREAAVAAKPPAPVAPPMPVAPPADGRLAARDEQGGRNRRLTWTSLVDESAEELDLTTRLKIIEALGLVGGSWSREILARAYEQEMDATVRGAIFLALRDSKSAA